MLMKGRLQSPVGALRGTTTARALSVSLPKGFCAAMPRKPGLSKNPSTSFRLAIACTHTWSGDVLIFQEKRMCPTSDPGLGTGGGLGLGWSSTLRSSELEVSILRQEGSTSASKRRNKVLAIKSFQGAGLTRTSFTRQSRLQDNCE